MDLHWRQHGACKSTAARDGIERSDENRGQELEVGLAAPISWRGLAILLCSGIDCCVRLFCDWVCGGRPRVWKPLNTNEGRGGGGGTAFCQGEVGQTGVGSWGGGP